jgi:hypothetical protein
MPRLRITTTLLILLAPPALLASGSYRAVPVRPGQVDTTLYHRGRDIFTGKLSPAALQDMALKEIEDSLPENIQKRANLSRLSGKLNPYQMEALSFYLAVELGIESLEEDFYEEGRAIFEGDAPLAKTASAFASRQVRKLAEWQALLPEEARSESRFSAYAGRLTDDQVAALGYHIAVRYRLPAVDQETFDLGRNVFRGKLEASEGMKVAASWQRDKLADLEARLPEDARAKAGLEKLAGRLSPDQMAALEYFLRIRYGLKT